MTRTYTILVVDDDHDDQQFFSEALQAQSSVTYSLKSVHNGRQALEYLATGVVPDFIVLDLNMPVLDGHSLLKILNLSPAYRHIPVFVLTTSSVESDIMKCKQMGCRRFFTKPVALSDLVVIAGEMLRLIRCG